MRRETLQVVAQPKLPRPAVQQYLGPQAGPSDLIGRIASRHLMTTCPDCSFGIAPGGEYCHCDNGHKRRELDQRRANEAKVREELRAAKLAVEARESGQKAIPRRMRGFTFDSYMLAIQRNFQDGDQTKHDALLSCREYARNFSLMDRGAPVFNLVMVGDVGTGKTGLAIPILKAGIAQGLRVAYVDFSVFISECHAAELRDKERSILNLCELDLVALDDLGTTKRQAGGVLKAEAPDTIRIATQIIDYRMQRFLPTIITSNLDVTGLAAQFDPRLASRLIESSAVLWIGGRDMRIDSKLAPGEARRL